MSESNHPVIEFDHVSKIYPNGVVGLKDIDLTINHGEFVVVRSREKYTDAGHQSASRHL